MKKLIECVPNFSEGNDMGIIRQITDEIETVEGVKLLDVDPGKATNRTVVTFVGEPLAVVEAAFRAIRKASQLIDMSKHKGEHPRMGATDVCPFIPISGVTMEEAAEYSKILAKRVGEDLQIPVFLYEYAASDPRWKNLANIRAGEYEGMAEKLARPDFNPDFGPKKLHVTAGVTAIGARDFLVAYNVNLNTTSVRRANSVAFDVREQGRVKTDNNGKNIVDADGQPVRIPGACKSVKGIGWFIEEYGIAQVSMNLTNINDTPLHIAFEECCKSATQRGMRVTGSEIVGLVPLKVMLDAGRYFLRQQQRSVGVSEEELIKIAVKTMGLSELSPFDPKKKIIEYVLAADEKTPLLSMNLRAFANETASESPAPGGGSIAAYMGALAASLGAMVANLSSHKRGWDDQWEKFSNWAELGQTLKEELLWLVEEDTKAFNRIMAAFALPKTNDTEKAQRSAAIQDATLYATEIPMRTLRAAFRCFELLRVMAAEGNPNSASDAGVGALAARAAVHGACLNVRTNAASLSDKAAAERLVSEASNLAAKADVLEKEIVEIAKTKM